MRIENSSGTWRFAKVYFAGAEAARSEGLKEVNKSSFFA